MTEVIPAIIAHNIQEIQDKIKLVEDYASWVHIDVMDGKFTPQLSWPYSAASFAKAPEAKKATNSTPYEGETISDLASLSTSLNLEIHLMTEKPETHVHDWLEQILVKRIIFHYEATHEHKFLIHTIKDAAREAVMALKLETPTMIVNDFLKPNPYTLDAVQLMGIAEIGAHGFPFDERVLEKIKILRERYPKLPIEIDGGVNLETARKCVAAGTTRFVSGGYIFNSQNSQEAIASLQAIFHKK